VANLGLWLGLGLGLVSWVVNFSRNFTFVRDNSGWSIIDITI